MPLERFEQLDVCKVAHTLVLDVYQVTKEFPAGERLGLVLQMRRAATSVPANIAEGFKRRGKMDKIRFYHISEGSLEELGYFFLLSRDLGYLIDYGCLSAEAERVSKTLSALIKSIRN